MKTFRIAAVFAAFALTAAAADRVLADPLPGEVLKFQQLPLNNGQPVPNVPGVPPGAPYEGHDEWSTALANKDAVGNIIGWRGDYMADDFGDKVSTPVVHIRWWGSYDQNVTGNAGVQKFLVSFESDVPALTGTVSHPGTPIQSEIITRTNGPLTAGSGNFQEQIVNGNMQEHLFQYNADLALPFQEQANQVYWLKIVALVDPTADGAMKWGWHDRDWSIADPYASTTAPSTPGESVIGSVVNSIGTPVPVWHYQDDAVTGPIDITPIVPGGLFVDQHQTWNPQFYIDGVDGPLSPGGIGQFSKDLAFELYTPAPEPSSVVLLGMGAIGLSVVAWRRRRVR